ncbi:MULTISPECIES: hypothetical protein [unclassified Vibrio]|uniref:hypothetical protein n=1 Tax=unclassified Vibrio TaxID=2614977 RepID=UPI0028100B86|nr:MULTISPECIES: hypothetical protein [unclassified Vibrio]MDW1499691.1 hypothetical protein [Vibrio sp. YT-19(2023)]MDW2102697.1 hypothetical protein [Vibrio sp. 1580]HCG7257447.1 hypothetical protein [Vibrio parahaemolyticus]HDU8587088.1 hypothetical protein [Vibrio alginolyticus]
MGWFSNNIEPIDQDLLDKVAIHRYKQLAMSYNYCKSELNKENLTDVEKLTLEVNKRKLIDKAVELLDSLEHKEVIAINNDKEDLSTTYLFKDYISFGEGEYLEKLTQYLIK